MNFRLNVKLKVERSVPRSPAIFEPNNNIVSKEFPLSSNLLNLPTPFNVLRNEEGP